MKKKAFVEVDVAAAVIIVLLFIFLMASVGFMEKSIFEIEESKNTLNNDLFLINLLKAKTSHGQLQQIIVSDYLQDDYSQTKEQINTVLQEAFGERVCWKLLLGNIILQESNNCKEIRDLQVGEIDATVKIPYQEADEINNLEVIFQS